jgi:uncharacterized protein YbaA (DUF1428 family)
VAYIDGFIIPIQTKNLKAYKKMATLGKKAWMKHGALDYKECVGDDLAAKWGTPFTKMLNLKKGETAIFAFIVFKSKAHRNKVNAKVMKEFEDGPKEMPFDMQRMAYGGFKGFVEVK